MEANDAMNIQRTDAAEAGGGRGLEPASTSRRRLRDDAVDIWRAGVAAVDSANLVRQCVRVSDDGLTIGEETFSWSTLGRIVVIGAGKAGAGMAAGVEAALGPTVVDERVTGWVNVPSDCVTTLRRIHLHAARPAGMNEPCPEGVFGAERMLELCTALEPHDLCLCLISGGGSALLPAPVPGVSLEEKRRLTKSLSGAGASIHQLNAVRRRLSRVKGGGLLRAMRAGRAVSLIISDVIGDPLDVIASGLTYIPSSQVASSSLSAIDVLRRFPAVQSSLSPSVRDLLERPAADLPAPIVSCTNLIIGRNATALDAAGRRAAELGYDVERVRGESADIAREDGRRLAELCLARRSEPRHRPLCILSGGEPVVELAPADEPRKGGRNQELALAALDRLWNESLDGIAILSGGTDGEDGPTDAAGGVIDAATRERAQSRSLEPGPFLAINNSYPFLDATGSLLRTGPTHTNVMDVRVALVDR